MLVTDCADQVEVVEAKDIGFRARQRQANFGELGGDVARRRKRIDDQPALGQRLRGGRGGPTDMGEVDWIDSSRDRFTTPRSSDRELDRTARQTEQRAGDLRVERVDLALTVNKLVGQNIGERSWTHSATDRERIE